MTTGLPKEAMRSMTGAALWMAFSPRQARAVQAVKNLRHAVQTAVRIDQNGFRRLKAFIGQKLP